MNCIFVCVCVCVCVPLPFRSTAPTVCLSCPSLELLPEILLLPCATIYNSTNWGWALCWHTGRLFGAEWRCCSAAAGRRWRGAAGSGGTGRPAGRAASCEPSAGRRPRQTPLAPGAGARVTCCGYVERAGCTTDDTAGRLMKPEWAGEWRALAAVPRRLVAAQGCSRRQACAESPGGELSAVSVNERDSEPRRESAQIDKGLA